MSIPFVHAQLSSYILLPLALESILFLLQSWKHNRIRYHPRVQSSFQRMLTLFVNRVYIQLETLKALTRIHKIGLLEFDFLKRSLVRLGQVSCLWQNLVNDADMLCQVVGDKVVHKVPSNEADSSEDKDRAVRSGHCRWLLSSPVMKKKNEEESEGKKRRTTC